MDTTMELDDFKQAWQTLDRRLEQHNTLTLQVYRDGKLDKARAGLRPLRWGQVAQIVAGALLALLAGSFWVEHRQTTHLLVAGLIVHAYAVLMIVFGARTLTLVSRIDYAAPVLDIQRQLALLRSYYVRGGLVVGLPWWVLWIPLQMMLLMSLFGVDLYERAPEAIYIGTAVGLAGWLLTWGFLHWSRHSGRPRLVKSVEDGMTGGSLRKAQQFLDEIARFELE
jgi:hypothetical protein